MSWVSWSATITIAFYPGRMPNALLENVFRKSLSRLHMDDGTGKANQGYFASWREKNNGRLFGTGKAGMQPECLGPSWEGMGTQGVPYFVTLRIVY